MYDLIIIGAGPAGIALAHCCSNIKLKILVIDSNDSIGGCHRVTRVNEYFTEHGPRIYSSAYLNFKMLLEEMGENFDKLFTPYDFQFTTIGNKTILSTLNLAELYVLFSDLVKLMLNDDYGKNITIKDHINYNNFTFQSADIMDKICRLTDGADSSKYTLNEFLQIVNQQLFYKIYQPREPNDIGLFKTWKNFLESKNVEFKLSTHVKTIHQTNNVATHITAIDRNGETVKFYGKTIIIAAPPEHIINILKNSDTVIKNAFGNFTALQSYSTKTKYINYIQATFHWNTKIKLGKVYGFPSSNWGIAFVVLSDYMKFNQNNSQTVVSAAITITDKVSDFTNKTANQSNKSEILQEMFRILNMSFGNNLPKPHIVIFNPHTKYKNNSWISEDTAFISSPNAESFDFKSKTIGNLYNVGTHNDKHLYRFTTLESAITNSIFLSHELFPELATVYPIKKLLTVKTIVQLFVMICVCTILIKLFYGCQL